MGSSAIQGELWGTHAEDWTYKAEPSSKPLWTAMLDATGVKHGTKLLDVGCGGGGLLQVAFDRGAEITGVDASRALINIASGRLPKGNFHVADSENLPFATGTFDVVTACNAIQFADDQRAAVRDAKRVLKPGGKFAIGMWCEMERTEMRLIFQAVGAIAPPPPQTEKEQPTLSIKENLISLVESAGFGVQESRDVATPFTYPNMDEAWLAFRSAGLIVGVMQATGEEKLRATVFEVLKRFEQADGSIRIENCFRYLVCS